MKRVFPLLLIIAVLITLHLAIRTFDAIEATAKDRRETFITLSNAAMERAKAQMRKGPRPVSEVDRRYLLSQGKNPDEYFYPESPTQSADAHTIMLLPGAKQIVRLECSTNLMEWTTATNGVYGSMPVAKFFRIKAEPVP